MTIEQSVAEHYSHGSLDQAIRAALLVSGKDPDRLSARDLAAVDEFHVGGRQAAVDLIARLGLTPDMHVLDVGCGIGGAARAIAETAGCRATGIDLSPEYVEVAAALTDRAGLGARVSFRQASALAPPFADASFDAAVMLHVGMNIADKARLFAELRRVLKRGARLGVYDVMRTGAGALRYPLTWAMGAETSFVEDAANYRRLLTAVGFAITEERERRDFALESFRRLRAFTAKNGSAPPLGLHIVMGETAALKVANLTALIEEGVIAPVEMIARSE